jgi:hypothetical protein
MNLFCPKCGRAILVDDVNLVTGLARCRACNNLFNAGALLPSPPPPVARSAPAVSPILPISRRLHIEEFGGVLRIRWRWFAASCIFLAFFCVAWDSFLVFWYSMALGHQGAPWIMKVFPIGHVAIGIGLTYATLCGFLNGTTVTAGQDALTVSHGPLPWSGNRTLASGSIRQIHCEQRRSNNNNNGAAWTYDLFATLSDGRKLKLLSGFNDLAEPRLIEQRIESHLRIADQAVVGEYRG